MKKFYLAKVFSVFMILAAVSLHGQDPIEYLTHISVAPYNPITGDYELFQYETFGYTNSGLLDSVTIQEVQDGELVNSALDRYKRNGFENMDSVFSYFWDPDFNSWDLIMMKEYEYFDSALISDFTTYSYQSGTYIPIFKSTYSYNPNNLQDSIWQFQYNLQANQWVNMSRIINTYLYDSLLSQQTIQFWYGNSYVNVQKTDYYKDLEGRDSMIINFDWVSNEWIFHDRTGIQYQQFNPVVKLNEVYQNGNWANNTVDSNEFNYLNNIIQNRTFAWTGTREWTPESRIIYDYDNLVGVYKPTASNSLTVRTFPVPSREKVTFSLPCNQAGKAIINVYNESGEVVYKSIFEYTERDSNNFTWDIDPSMVPGLYFYEIIASGKATSGKLIISR